jgi:hypothetical protein
MTFLHLWPLILGAVALGLPIAIHFLTKPRPMRLPLSTIRFVREAIQQRRAKHRLRDIIILTLRTCALLLIAIAIARPLWGEKPLISTTESTAAARVVILDCSQSMGATATGIQLFERARSVAAGYLGDQPSVQGNLILAGASSRPVFERLSGNYTALRQELTAATVRPERLNVQAALDHAAKLLNQAEALERKRELIIVSDFQRTSWAAADFSGLPQDTVIQLESVAPKEPLSNLAILRVGGPSRAEQGREVRLEVEVGNYSMTARNARVEVVLGSAVYQLQGLCPPWMKTTLTADIAPQAAGWQGGEARLLDVQDALAADNSRAFVLEVRPLPMFVLLTRQPTDRKPSSSYFLETALSPSLRAGRKDDRVKRMDPGQIDRDILTSADVIVIDHPGKLSQETLQLLASLMRRGRGILYVTSEGVDATNLQLLKQAAGTDLQLPVEFQPPPPGQLRRNLFLPDDPKEVKRDQPPFSIFGDELKAVLGLVRFSGGLSSRRVEGGLSDDILASYNDRSACLVVTACGAGTLAVLNTDLGASNFAKERPFVTFLGELIGRLLGRSRLGDTAVSGEPLTAFLPATAGPAQGLNIVSLSSSSKSTTLGELRESNTGLLWHFDHAGLPGIYQVQRNGTPVYSLAIGIPGEESDLRPLEPSVLKERLSGGRTVVYHAASGVEEDPQDIFWVWLAVGCVFCLLGELVALKLFRT